MEIMDNVLEIILITSIIVWIFLKYRDRGSTSRFGEGEIKELITTQLSPIKESSRKTQQVVEEVLSKKVEGLDRLFRGSRTRGDWGEVALRNAVKYAGMTDHVDFNEQEPATDMDGKSRVIDMVINYPDGSRVVLDSKTPMEAYMKSLDADDDRVKERELDNHVEQVKDAVKNLSRKKYQSLVNKSPDYIIMYMPNEAAFMAAMERAPDLIEWALKKKVVVTCPRDFVVTLKQIHLAWQQLALHDQAKQIGIESKELTRRFETLLQHLQGVYKGLNQARNNWNKFVSSYERRFLPQAKKLTDLDVWENVPELDRLDVDTQELLPSEVEQAISSNGHRG